MRDTNSDNSGVLPNAVTISRDWSRGCEGGGWPKWSPIVTKPLFFLPSSPPEPLSANVPFAGRHSTRTPPLHLDDPIIRGRRWRLAIRQHWYANEIWRPCFSLHTRALFAIRTATIRARIIIFLLSFNPWRPRSRAPRFDYFNGVTLSRIEKDLWENLATGCVGRRKEESRNVSFCEGLWWALEVVWGEEWNQSLGRKGRRMVLWRRIYWGKLDW